MKRGSWFAVGSLLATKATGAKPGIWDALMVGVLAKNEILDKPKDREKAALKAELKEAKKQAKEETLREERLNSSNHSVRVFWEGFYRNRDRRNDII